MFVLGSICIFNFVCLKTTKCNCDSPHLDRPCHYHSSSLRVSPEYKGVGQVRVPLRSQFMCAIKFVSKNHLIAYFLNILCIILPYVVQTVYLVFDQCMSALFMRASSSCEPWFSALWNKHFIIDTCLRSWSVPQRNISWFALCSSEHCCLACCIWRFE